MDLNSFLQKYTIKLDPAMSDLCGEGMRRMRASADPLHNEAHVFNVTQLADQLLENERSLDRQKINLPVLLVSICWHDVWKTTRSQPTHLWQMVYTNTFDGLGSMREIIHYVRQNDVKVSPGDFHIIKGAILRHPGYEYTLPLFVRRKILNGFSVEANVLRDADKLDTLNIGRSTHFRDWYMNRGKLHPRSLTIVDFWLRHFVVKSREDLVFDYSRRLFNKQVERYFTEFLLFYSELYNHPDRYFQQTKKPIEAYFKYTPAEYRQVLNLYIEAP